MTQSELNTSVNRLFSFGKDIFKKLALADTVYINEEKLQIDGDFTGEPYKVHLKLSIYPENGIVTLFSLLPYEIDPEKATSFAKLVCSINYNDFYTGNFDYNIEKGRVVFRLAILFRGSIISRELVEEAVNYTVSTVSKYNPRLFEASR